tara:strand:+ start:86 stop:454 length:369 start_codon:yes stop_codon:yes gene_type:complete
LLLLDSGKNIQTGVRRRLTPHRPASAAYPEYYGSIEPWLDYLGYMASISDHDLPTTISYSYEEGEAVVPQDFALKVCEGFLALAARDVSNLFASGDGGPGDYCYWSSEDHRPSFQGMFPSTW